MRELIELAVIILTIYAVYREPDIARWEEERLFNVIEDEDEQI